jgi:hypothetical protein
MALRLQEGQSVAGQAEPDTPVATAGKRGRGHAG